MKYLLDTQVVLWALMSQRKLPPNVKVILESPKSECYVSVISMWEISLKYKAGKLDLENKLPSDFPNGVEDLEYKTIDLDFKTASTFYNLPRHKNKDPFDRMIAWQAINENMILISKDKEFDNYNLDGLKRVW